MNFIYNAPVERGAPGTLMPSANRPMLSLPQHIKTLLLGVKLAALLILTTCLQVSAKITTAQKLSISFHNGSLEKLFAEIEKKTQYVFFYDVAILKGTKPVTIEMKDANVDDILKTSLKGQALDYSINDKTIFVKKVERVSGARVIGGPGNGVPAAVTGVVKSESGTPLIGASITIKKLKKTGVTNENGEFVLRDVPDGEYDVDITFVGFEQVTTRIKVVDHQAVLTAAMKQAMGKLDETVVKGYYNTTNRLNTGNVTTVRSEEIREQPVANPLAAMEGRVPGMYITQTTGNPGGGFKVQIRGQSSIFSGNDPFYVIDGVPYPSKAPSIINSSLQFGSPLNFININDIESIEVLKDADATSIYGSRAANGAILITTKKGKAGKMKVDVNAYAGIGKTSPNYKPLNTQQYLEMRREAYKNDGETPGTADAPDILVWDTSRYTNWAKVLAANPAHYSDIQTAVSGGTTNTQYLIGGGYHRETTSFPNSFVNPGADQKASVHFNLTTSSEDKKLKVSLSGSYLTDVNTVQSTDLTTRALTLAPDAPSLFNPDGSLNWAPISPGQLGTWTNPYSYLINKYKSQTSNLLSNAFISYSPVSGLEIKVSAGYTTTQTNEVATFPAAAYDPGYGIGYAIPVSAITASTFNSTNTRSWIVEPQAEYRINLGKGLFSALVGMTFHENNTYVQTSNASGFVNDALLENLASAGTVSTTISAPQYNYSAGFGRLSYNWQDKYVVNLTARRDGSSRFGPGRQFANFGAVGAAWIFSNENFFKRSLSFISFGKLRGSYGTSGNDQIGDYRFLDLYSSTAYSYQGLLGTYPSNLFNPDLAWELDKKLEGGIELGFLKDRILITASYFQNRSGNQLVGTPLSTVTGFGSIPSNLPAMVQNTGLEVTVNTINVRSKNFRWTSSINLTVPRNKLLAFPSLSSSSYKNTYVIGQPLNIKKVLHYIGVNDTTGIYQFATSKGEATYTPQTADLTTIVSTNPKFYGGIANSIQFKDFKLDFLFQFVKQTGVNWYSVIIAGQQSNQPDVVLNRWQKPGDKKPFEMFTQDPSSLAYRAANTYGKNSDLTYSDASFIRLKNVSLSYIIPGGWKQKAHIQNARIYLQGQNLLTITKYLGVDPESQGGVLPPLHVWTAGFQIAF